MSEDGFKESIVSSIVGPSDLSQFPNKKPKTHLGILGFLLIDYSEGLLENPKQH